MRMGPQALGARAADRYISLICLPPGQARHEFRGPAMTTFDKREDSFEKKFAHDEELRFRATARRNKRLAAWAAEKLGKPAADADAYFKEVMAADLEEAGDDDVVRKLTADFAKAGVEQSEHQIRRTMDELMATAVAEIKAGK